MCAPHHPCSPGGTPRKQPPRRQLGAGTHDGCPSGSVLAQGAALPTEQHTQPPVQGSLLLFKCEAAFCIQQLIFYKASSLQRTPRRTCHVAANRYRAGKTADFTGNKHSSIIGSQLAPSPSQQGHCPPVRAHPRPPHCPQPRAGHVPVLWLSTAWGHPRAPSAPCWDGALGPRDGDVVGWGGDRGQRVPWGGGGLAGLLPQPCSVCC